MYVPIRTQDPQSWIDQIFSTKSAQSGGVVRRNKAWVEQEIGIDRFIAEVQLRRFHLIDAGKQLIVICNQHPIRILF